MIKTKKIISVFLVILALFNLSVPAFAEGENDAQQASSSVFDLEDASKVALTAAKSKMILEGLSSEVSGQTVVTKVSYDKANGRYKVTVRSQYKFKYSCVISIKEIFGKEIGYIADSTFEEQNVVKGFFGQGFEKFTFFFIKLFKMADRA